MQADRIIREPEVREISGLSRTTRWRLEREGKFPARRKLSDNAIGWLESEIRDWVATRNVSHQRTGMSGTAPADHPMLARDGDSAEGQESPARASLSIDELQRLSRGTPPHQRH
jgi:prophage regulatory protein